MNSWSAGTMLTCSCLLQDMEQGEWVGCDYGLCDEAAPVSMLELFIGLLQDGGA